MSRIVFRPLIGAVVWFCSVSIILANPLVGDGGRGATRAPSEHRRSEPADGTAEPIPPDTVNIGIIHPNGLGLTSPSGVIQAVYDSLPQYSGFFSRPMLGRYYFDDVSTILDNAAGGIIDSYDVVVHSSITVTTPPPGCAIEAAIPYDVTTTLWYDDQLPPDVHVTGAPLSPIAMSTCNFTGIQKGMTVTLTCPMVGQVGAAPGSFWVGTNYSSDCAGWVIAGLSPLAIGFSDDFVGRSFDNTGAGPYSFFSFDGCGTVAGCANFMTQIRAEVGPDIDGDGVANDFDPAPGNPFICGDFDLDTCDDCSVTGGPPDPADDGPDSDADGTCDDGECPCNSDVDGNSLVNIFDVLAVLECVSGLVDPACDVNCDGRINYCDVDVVLDGFIGIIDCSQTCAACCINGSACTETTQENCEASPPFGAGGVYQGPGTTCGVQNAAIFDEPGGEVFVHVIGPPVECPASGGFQRPAAGCVPNQHIDAWTSNADAQMCHRFGVTGSPPIPADFFDPGSNPFSGVVCLAGQPLGPTPYGEFVGADTLILRTADPFDRCALPSLTPVDVPIEIVELNLHGAQPITVTYNNGTPQQQWNVRVDLSQFGPAPQGALTVHKTHCNGGTYTSTLPVQPRFTFTRVDQPSKVEVLDTGEFGIPPIVLQQENPFPWVSNIDPSLGYLGDACTDFHPGIQEPNASSQCDCQNNGLLDGCEIDNGLPDTNANGTPDECELAACCLGAGGCVVTNGLSCSGLPGIIQSPGTLCDEANCSPPCTGDADCDDDYACTHDACSFGVCSNTLTLYGNVDNVGGVDIFDILCVLQGFGGFFGACAENNLDIAPCPQGDGMIDIFDILAVLDGFAGEPGCCAP
ncbi:MAG: hypothetical protein HOP29_04865 [Phycisphaerales bacterium]|nr:hypothetical protein [Phycisphaerales bacterium]